MNDESMDQIIARLEAAKLDVEELEHLRRKTRLAILAAMGVTLPDADKLDSEALREILDREQARAA